MSTRTLSDLRDAAKQTDTPLRTAAEIALTDDDRQRRRAVIRKIMAENAVVQNRINAIRSSVQRLERELDFAVNEHQEQTQPIQSRLGELNTAEVNQLVAGDSGLAPTLAAERDDLQQELDILNDRLEAKSDEVKRKVRTLKNEAAKLQKELNTNVSEHSLRHPDLVNPKLADELFVAQQRIAWAKRRHDTAVAHCERYKVELQLAQQPPRATLGTHTSIFDINYRGELKRGSVDHSTIAIYTRRLSRWEMEANAAQAELSTAMRESDRIAKEIVSE